jgi:hypothetical protein
MLQKAHRTSDQQDLVVQDSKKESVMRRYIENGDERNGQMIYERRIIGVKPEQLMYLFEKITDT